MIYFVNKKQILLALSLVIAVLAGCKKYPNPPTFNEKLDNTVVPARRVIVISIDGVTGSELKTIAPPAITALLPASKYSFATFKSAVATDAASWTSMLTGVPYAKHLVATDDFQPTSDPNSGEHDAVPIRRNVLDYIMSGIGTKTAFISPWANLRNYVKVADYRPVVNSDLAAKDSTISLLSKYEGIGATMVNFREAEAAGANGGYVASNAAYKDAILKADGYVDEIIKAIKARKTYANEEWLFIITSNHGGSSDNPTAGFMVVNNPSLKSLELKKVGFNAIKYNSNSIGAKAGGDNSFYDSGTTGSFTVQMQTKFNNTTTFYPIFLSKSTPITGSVQTGWAWFQQDGSRWGVSVGGSANGSGISRQQVIGGSIADGNWHTLTMTVKYVNATTRTVTTYTDGVLNNTGNISTHKSLSTTEPLYIGYKTFAGGSLDFYGANLQYYNVALDQSIIQGNLSIKDITKHPNYGNLIGFWKMDEGAEGTFQNTAPSGYNMNLAGPYLWTPLGTDAPSQSNFEGSTGYSLAPAAADIGALMMYWTKTKIDPVFDITGKPFLKDFEAEFLK